MSFSSFELTNGTITTPLLLFNTKLGIVCIKLIASLSTLLKNVLTTLRNPLSGFFVKGTRIPTPFLLQNLWKCVETARMAIKSRIAVAFQLKVIWMMKNTCSDQQKNVKDLRTYERSTLRGRKSQIWNRTKETNHCLFVQQYTLLRALEFYYDFFKTICDTEKFDEMETDTRPCI